MITVNSRKYDGTIRRSWTCELLEQCDSLLLFVGKFAAEVEHSDLGRIAAGTISYEYYWTDRWYNVFRFHEPSGELRNFYCNINMPPAFDGTTLDYVDLDIDVLVWPDYSYEILDREDFDESAGTYGYPPQVHEEVEAALKEVLELIDRRGLPSE